MFDSITRLHKSRFIKIFADSHNATTPKELEKARKDAQKLIDPSKGNKGKTERQRLLIALGTIRNSRPAEQELQVDKERESNVTRAVELADQLAHDIEQAELLQNDLNAAVLKGETVVYNLKDQDGHIHGTTVVKLDSDSD